VNIDQYITSALQFALKDPTPKGYEATISLLEKEYPNYPDHPRMYSNLATCLTNLAVGMKVNGYEDALKCFNLLKRALEIDKNPEAKYDEHRRRNLAVVANMAGLFANNKNNLDAMEEGIRCLRYADTMPVANPTEADRTICNIQNMALRCLLTFRLAEYYAFKAPDGPKLDIATNYIDEAVQTCPKEMIRDKDVNAQSTNETVLFTRQDVLNRREKILQSRIAKEAPAAPAAPAPSPAKDSSPFEELEGLIGLANVTVQAYTNLFSNEIIAGVGVAQRVTSYAQSPLHALTTVSTSFIGQNYGARKYDRVQEGTRYCLRLSNIISITLSTLIFIFAKPLVQMFNKDPEIVKYGVEMVRFTVYSTVFIGWSHIYNGVCRGAGNVKLPMIIAIFSQVVVRYIYVTIAFSISTSVYHIYVGSSIGFVVAGIVASIYFNFSKWTKDHHLRP